jgi:hypothetical protein
MMFTWSDMFDPNDNARHNGRYYCCKGDGPWRNSWLGLSPNVIVLNWFANSTNTLNWFAGNEIRLTVDGVANTPVKLPVACKQILCGYYDGPVANVDTWLTAAPAIKNPDGTNSVIGVMYTTWQADYSNLAAFANEVKKYCTLPPRLP